MTRANGTTTDYLYQPARLWLTGMKTTNAGGTVLQNLAYTRDVRGRITASASDVAAENWNYGYDNFDRLTAATNTVNAALTQSFTYDAVDNITWNSLKGTYTYPAPGQPHPHAVLQAPSLVYTYDANGNPVSVNGNPLVYDGENRLVQCGASSFVYAPDGSRLKKTVSGTTTLYIGDDWEVSGGVSTYYLPGDAVMTGVAVPGCTAMCWAPCGSPPMPPGPSSSAPLPALWRAARDHRHGDDLQGLHRRAQRRDRARLPPRAVSQSDPGQVPHAGSVAGSDGAGGGAQSLCLCGE